MSKYLEWIDEQITFHEREISKLVIAREVVATVDGSQPKVERIRIAPKTMPKGKPRGLMGKPKGDTLNKIKTVFDRPHMSVGEIARATMERYPEISDKMVYNALYNATKAGVLVRGADKLYSVASTQ